MNDETAKVLPFPAPAKPTVRVTLWEGRRRPDEDNLRDQLAADGYQAVKWTSEAATGYPPHAHVYPELLWVISGNLVLILPDKRKLLDLWPGDRVEIPAGLSHGTMAGADGAAYLLATK